MALNQALVGKVYPPSPSYEVGREKLREFAIAIGDRNPAFHDEAAARDLGHRDLVAAPTFVFSVAFRAMAQAMFDPELGIDYSRVVHGEQHFAYSRPVTAGDRLVVTTTIENIRVAAGNDILTTRSEVHTVEGEHVVTAWSTTVARGTAAQEG